MHQIERFATDAQGRPQSYSQVVRYGSLIITAGHLTAKPDIEVSIEEQTRSALRALLSTIERAGGSAGSILRINAYLATMDDFEAYDSVYREVMGFEERPTRTTVQTGGFKPPYLVEVDAMAVTHDDDAPSST